MAALIAIAFYTLRERKLLGYMQYRKGPNKPSIIGIAVPLADANKLFLKEEKSIILSNTKYLFGAPIVIITLSLLSWPLYPHSNQSIFLKFGIIYFICLTRINVYATFIAGWGSNSKWRILGALRGIAQTISYEVRISLIIICIILHQIRTNILSLIYNHYLWTILIVLPLIAPWTISILAETHRAPLDFSEGESELVSGFNIEYRRSIFALIFIAEYINILFIRLMTVSIISRNLSNSELILKTVIISTIFIWARGALPRARYDILIDCLWKKILPLTLCLFIIILALIVNISS